jgi:hypothetical protein
MEKVHEEYPKDQQAAVFYALSLLTWSVDHDPLANPKKAIAILNQVFEANPNDRGAAHYLIHAADAPQLAQLGLTAARRYVTPKSPLGCRMRCTCRRTFLPGWVYGVRTSNLICRP